MVGMEDLALIVKRLEVVTEKLEAVGEAGGAGAGAAASQAEKLTISVTAFDDICGGVFKAFLENCAKVGGEVQTAASILAKAFSAQRQFLLVASKSRQPAPALLAELLRPTGDCIDEIQAFREKMRRCDFFNHLSALSEAIPALGWVTVSPAPAPFVQEMNHAGQFYTNRVLKDWKEKNHVHVEWVKSWLQTLTELQAYVKQFHTTGLVWNKAGEDAAEVARGAATATAAPPPPPPPGPPAPPPPPPMEAAAVNGEAGKSGRAELLESLNQGEAVTSGLRKVTDEEKTHKNPALRSSGPAPAPAPDTSRPKAAAAPGKAARTELEGKRWNVEHHVNNREKMLEIVIDGAELQQSVYVYKCSGCTVQVRGKCSNIVLDQCNKTGLVFDSVVAGVELVNCQSVQVQVTGSAPTISVEKTDGCQMFLSQDSLGVNIISSKSSEMNVMIPGAEEFVEVPVPEQFMTTVSGTRLETRPVNHELLNLLTS